MKLRRVGKQYMIVDASGANVNLTNVYTLNSTAAWLWEQAAAGDFTEESLLEKMYDHFEVTRDLAEKDIRALMDTWRKFDLLVE